MNDLGKAMAIALNLLDPGISPSLLAVEQAAKVATATLEQWNPDSQIDLNELIRHLEANLNVAVGPESTLEEDSDDHAPWLDNRRSTIDWNFSNRYRRFLQEVQGWARSSILRSNEITDRTLDLLEDPERPGPWDRRGMVVGEVQSGKTSNYIQLVCKAADAGFKFIVILTGTTNSLRAQTQLRIDEGFLGWDTTKALTARPTAGRLGVGLLPGAPDRIMAIPSTSAAEHGDFNLKVARQFNVRLGGPPVIMIVKKNASVLRNLTSWAQSQVEFAIGDTGADIPTLVIDDEADYASVNTRPIGIDEDPTAINGRIRELLRVFARSAYVGYTATPFANIFIYPDEENESFGRDLFPRDFLINLPVPSNHIGPKRVFGLPVDSELNDGSDPLPLVRLIRDSDSLIPNVHKKNLQIADLPSSLKRATRVFILSCAARAARGDESSHNSMLVHVTRFVDVQTQVAELIGFELEDLKNRIRYGDGGSTLGILDELHKLWVSDFVPTSQNMHAVALEYPKLGLQCPEVTWNSVCENLQKSSQKIRVKVINGAANDVLDYRDRPDGMNAIVVGGDKLSRGLTLEGLSVSYYLRASRMYDTLLQMGRWFGFRSGYADLCRLYTTDELRESFCHITMATEELREEFDLMARRGMTPSQFGLRVRSHPAGLVITSTNKMRSGTSLMVSYSGAISETITFFRDPVTNGENHVLFDGFLRSLQSPACKRQNKTVIWRDVPGATVAELLDQIQVHPRSRKAIGVYLAKYIRSQIANGGLTDWWVALISVSGGRSGVSIGGHSIGAAQRAQFASEMTDSDAVYRIRRLVSPIDETIGLSRSELASALALTEAARLPQNAQSSGPRRPSGLNIRRVRSAKTGLLLIYPLAEPDSNGIPLTGFAVSFPTAERETPVEYVVNPVYLRGEFEEE